MRILIAANSFHPAVGGYERVAWIIADQLAARGHSVKVVTFTPGDQDNAFPFEVYRKPGVRAMIRLLRWSDVYLQNNVSFKMLWPLLFCWRPVVCVHHGFYAFAGGLSWTDRLKLFVTHFTTNLSVSRAVAQTLPSKSYVTLNPYREEVFYRIPGINKDRDLFFVGRVVSDKGIDLLVDAVAALRQRGLKPTLTVAGAGPEEAALRARVQALQLTDLVTFAGRVTDQRLNELLNGHKIMVVPTREGEGFGVVALEGIACGCVVVGSTNGGLPEAIGPCGRTFASGDPTALADVLYELLTSQDDWTRYFANMTSHLEVHRPSVVADRYVEALTRISARKH